MKNPVIADNKPKQITLNKGEEYYFCNCGKSNNQPFCDGSHAGTDFTPTAFTAEQDDEAHLCMCKHSANKPYCDGTHQQFSQEDIGKAISVKAENSNDVPVAKKTLEEPTVEFIHHELPLARDGLSKLGPEAKKPLRLKIPLFVSDMSFGALSEEAKISLAKGADLAGTGICSGEGGMLPEEQEANSRYFYEYASAGFGYKEELLKNVQAFHFKGGQGAKTGTGGHLPGNKNKGKISQVRDLPEGTPAVSPPTFKNLSPAEEFKDFVDRVREITGGIPIGFKLSANHIEEDIQFALDASADYIILDGRGGGTGAAPEMFRDHISVPTIPALARVPILISKVQVVV